MHARPDGGRVREEAQCERERPRNPTDPYSVVVKKDGITVSKSTQ